MKRGILSVWLARLLIYSAISGALFCVVWFAAVPAYYGYVLRTLAEEVEREGRHEAEYPGDPQETPGPAVKKMLRYGDRAAPYLLDLMRHPEYRVREKAFAGFCELSGRDDFDYDPIWWGAELDRAVDDIRRWWETEGRHRPRSDRRNPGRPGSRAAALAGDQGQRQGPYSTWIELSSSTQPTDTVSR